MAIELMCPDCGTEYWGPSSGAKCGSCDYCFDTMDKINYRDLIAYLEKRKEKNMQKFLSMAEVKAKINPDEILFSRSELINIKGAMEFIQEKFYYEKEDKKSTTYKNLMAIRDKCINALEK